MNCDLFIIIIVNSFFAMLMPEHGCPLILQLYLLNFSYLLSLTNCASSRTTVVSRHFQYSSKTMAFMRLEVLPKKVFV